MIIIIIIITTKKPSYPLSYVQVGLPAHQNMNLCITGGLTDLDYKAFNSAKFALGILN